MTDMCVKTIELRKWYKVLWKSDLPEQSGLKGKIDLIMDGQLASVRGHVKVLEEIATQTCASGVALGFGRANEERIEKWKEQNAVKVKRL